MRKLLIFIFVLFLLALSIPPTQAEVMQDAARAGSIYLAQTQGKHHDGRRAERWVYTDSEVKIRYVVYPSGNNRLVVYAHGKLVGRWWNSNAAVFIQGTHWDYILGFYP